MAGRSAVGLALLAWAAVCSAARVDTRAAAWRGKVICVRGVHCVVSAHRLTRSAGGGRPARHRRRWTRSAAAAVSLRSLRACTFPQRTARWRTEPNSCFLSPPLRGKLATSETARCPTCTCFALCTDFVLLCVTWTASSTLSKQVRLSLAFPASCVNASVRSGSGWQHRGTAHSLPTRRPGLVSHGAGWCDSARACFGVHEPGSRQAERIRRSIHYPNTPYAHYWNNVGTELPPGPVSFRSVCPIVLSERRTTADVLVCRRVGPVQHSSVAPRDRA